MEKLEELKLGKDLVGDENEQPLASYLLGKIMHCASGDYLITVTEAYPAEDFYSYIYRATHNEDYTEKSENEIDKNGKAYKILTDENKVGKFFLYGGMLHLAGKANEANARIELDNVLIRGAVKIEDSTLIIDDNINMNFGEGRPTTLVKTLKIDDNNLSTLRIYNSSLSFTSKQCERIGLKGKDEGKSKTDAEARYRFFINKIKI